MSALLAWACASAAVLVAAVRVRRGARRAELVVRACHEVRGPLTAARLALDAGAGAAAVAGELQRAGAAVDDLAAAVAGARRVEHRRDVDLARFLRDQEAVWGPVARRRGARLRVDCPAAGLVVRLDPLRLAQVTANLVTNALDHGASTVVVRASGRDGRVRLEVCDDGPGLPAPVADLTARARRGHGTRGRGLAVVADIARRAGGRLVGDGSESGGARLAVDLPRAR